VQVFPVWNFGLPAMLKGFFDRVPLPGVSFDMSDPRRVAGPEVRSAFLQRVGVAMGRIG